MIPLQYNVRSLFVRKTTTLATLLGVALVVFVLSSSQMLAHGIRRTMGRSGSPENAIVMRKGADAELSSSVESRLVGIVESAPGVARGPDGAPLGSPELVMVIAADLLSEPGQVSNVLVRGVTEDARRLRTEARVVEGREARPGTNEVVIGRRIRGKFRGIELGGSFDLNKNRPAVVVGVFETGGSSFESEIWTDLDAMRAAFGREGQASSVTVRLASRATYESFAAAMETDKQLGLKVMRESDYYEKQSEGTSDFVRMLGNAIVFFFSLGAMIGAMITMYGTVANRRREVGTLRALGFPRITILVSFLFESTLLALFGGAIGALASLAMGFVHLSMMNQATWSEMVFSFEPSPQLVLGAILAGGLMGVLGGFLPAWSAARTSPVAAMRGE